MIQNYLAAGQVGICIVLMVFSPITSTDKISKRRRWSLFLMAFLSMIFAVSDRVADMYIGIEDIDIYWYARIAKFMVYSIDLLVVLVFNQYIKDFLPKEKLKIVDYIIIIGLITLILSQFYGWYYIFDTNGYRRTDGYLVSYIFPIVSLIIQFIVIIQGRKNIRRRMLYPMLLFIWLPIIASIIRFFIHNSSLTSMTIVSMIVLLYGFSIMDTNTFLMLAHKNEIKALEDKEKFSKTMIEQLTDALTGAIDAKDKYTEGHSRRVSEYSVLIAKETGKSVQECEEIRMSALLHDVGKIGVPTSIINKAGKLTDEEYDTMKKHTIIGRDILDRIPIFPSLRIGATYHHERYDGKGYPFGLKGTEIPEIARIIGVADAYDAMTSKRSYRDAMSQDAVRAEIEKGKSKQFDPYFADIMIKIIDADKDYTLKQH